jgi:hypothetical protein
LLKFTADKLLDGAADDIGERQVFFCCHLCQRELAGPVNADFDIFGLFVHNGSQ